MMENVLCQFDKGEDQCWDEYVETLPGASWVHLSGWKRIIEDAYKHKGLYLWEKEGGRVKGILPMIYMRTLPRGPMLVSLPFLDEGGICGDDDSYRLRLYEKAHQVAEDLKVRTLEFRHREKSLLRLPNLTEKVSMVLTLNTSSTEMWKGFDGKLRNQVRKAQKSNLTLDRTNGEGLEEFYKVFAVNMRDLGSPVHSYRFFQEILREFPEMAKLLLVKKEGRTIAGGICFHFKDRMAIPWASSLPQYRSLCPNNLLYWEAIQWGCDHGFCQFDFGRSTPGSGTYKFKKQWGATEQILHWESPNGALGISAPHAGEGRYRWIIDAWRKLPLPVTTFLGPLIRRQISL